MKHHTFRYRHRTSILSLLAALGFSLSAVADSPVVLTDSYTSAAATSETFCTTGDYPAQWTWDPSLTVNAPQPATSGTPLIKQYRNGQLIATYSILGSGSGDCTTDDMYAHPVTSCGPFGRVHTWRNWAEGDLFEVYPAIYSGLENQPWIGPLPKSTAEYNANTTTIPKNITIRGITVDGVRPVIKVGAGASYNTLDQSAVYLDQSEGITFENIDLDADGGSVGKAGIYVSGGRNITLRDMRIHGFKVSRANGIIGSDNNSGTVTLERIELYDNGGDSGPEHNIYMDKSAVDSSFTVRMIQSWSHDAFYGHLFKSRAQNNILEGNYFQGGLPKDGATQAENYLVDIPNGGILTMRNNILVKNASGPESNAMSVTFAMEGVPDSRALGITIEHNTFVALSKYYDSSHPLFPFSFFYPQQIPGASFPVSAISIKKNVFVGYCNTGDVAMDYRGDYYFSGGFADLDQIFSLKTNYVPTDTLIVGTLAYQHAAQSGWLRIAATFGAVDSSSLGSHPIVTPIPTPSPTPTPSIVVPGKPRSVTTRIKGRTLTVTWKAASGVVRRYKVELLSGRKVLKRNTLGTAKLRTTFSKLRRGSFSVRLYAGNSAGYGQAAIKNFRW